MPQILSCEVGGRSWCPSERQCERTAFCFYVAVRERLPVWSLEDLRCMEALRWDGGRPRPFLPSEALLYALVHDHQDYARFLLRHYSLGAMEEPVCGPGGSSLLTVAVRYERVSILRMMMEALKDAAGPGERQRLLEGGPPGDCPVQVAVQLSRPECLRLLLVHGARPRPLGLDAALERLLAAADAAGRRSARRCLDLLLLFAPQPLTRRHLQDEPQRWRGLLGAEVFGWLCGLSPAPLLLQALRRLAQTGPQHIAALPEFLQQYS